MKVDILTYKKKTWFSRKSWVAICQTKLPVEISVIYADSEKEAFEQMKNRVIATLIQLEASEYQVRTLDINTANQGYTMYWTGAALGSYTSK